MGEKKNYYLGLDMGTNSVGWAVTNPQYELLRAKGKDLWGVRLFENAQTSAERRGYRISRRRRQREVARMGMLRELFAPAIDEIDPGFFARLDDSKYQMPERSEDNKQPFALFADTGYTDKEYYRDYPTIFHLRKELLNSKEPHDVRLVYLAIANLYKRRGHFLNSSLSEDENVDSLKDIYLELQEKATELELHLPIEIDFQELENKLGEKGIPRKKVLENVAELFGVSKTQKREYQVLSLICGMTVKVFDIFGEEIIDEEHKKDSICFRASNYEEAAGNILELVGDENFELISLAKIIHDKGLLSSIMKGFTYLSEARVASYEDHKEDLRELKNVLKRYDTKAYHDMFRVMQEGNYSAYVGSVNSSDEIVRRSNKGRSRDELYKTIRSILKNLPQEDEEVQDILAKMDAEAFLPKQLTSDNGVIPNQLHVQEMKKILKNAEMYLPFLAQKDETGLTVSEKIIAIYKFQIPYYVGPLGQAYKDKKGYNVWAERKEGGKIYPWNFEEKIDVTESAKKFIERMVRHCTYLSGENALPKTSLLYEKFQVLNELNNLKVYGEKISVEEKQNIYRDLFSKGKKVSLSRLTNYLEINGCIKPGDKDAISGIDGGFQSSLTTIGKFYGLYGDAVYTDEKQSMIEDIVFWGTIYGNDKKFLKEKIQEKYAECISEQELKRILGFKFEGWGRLSKAFLELEGASKEDGEIRSLICALWETNDNLMELLSERYTYKEALEEQVTGLEKPLSEWTIEDLNEQYLSAPVKRMVWQTLSVVKELEEVIGNEPDRIFVEVAREDGEKNTRTKSRKQKLLDLYKVIGKEANDWKKEVENKDEAYFKPRKVYLYYLQMGQCMYTGEHIDFSELMHANSKYDIDHIYPRHYIKDDSLENNLVLVNKSANARKSDEYPLDDSIQKKQSNFWRELLKKGFITEEKYYRLTRVTGFTEMEKADFVNRQLVETRQGTKAITQIFKQAFPETEIIFSKANLVSDFRKKYELYKVRMLNNYHHAHDAYLNVVVGNTYYVKFTKNPLNFIWEAEKHPEKEEYKYHMDKIFDWDVVRKGEVAWRSSRKENPGTIKQVQKVLGKNSPLVTRYCPEYHGGITGKSTVWNAKTAKDNSYIPVKMNDERLQDVTRYGGVTSIAASGYALIEYTVKGEKIRSLEALPVYLGRVESMKEERMLAYFSNSLQVENKKNKVEDVHICRKFIPRGSLIRYNGFYYYLGGKTNSQIWVSNAVELCIDRSGTKYLKKMEKACQNAYFDEKENGQVILTKEKNEVIYAELKKKYESSIFRNQIGAVGSLVRNGEEIFKQLTREEQCFILLQIIKNIQTSEFVDLRLLGGAEKSGKNLISKKVSNANEVVLIAQSITGLCKAEINLLTV